MRLATLLCIALGCSGSDEPDPCGSPGNWKCIRFHACTVYATAYCAALNACHLDDPPVAPEDCYDRSYCCSGEACYERIAMTQEQLDACVDALNHQTCLDYAFFMFPKACIPVVVAPAAE